nr:unnamed protein product [Digitaria exilis]
MSQYLLASLSYFSAPGVKKTVCKHGGDAVVTAEEKGVTSRPEPVAARPRGEVDEEETRVVPSWGCCSPVAMALA